MGGVPPLGYRAQEGKLIIDEGEAETVRVIFRRYAELGSVADQRLGPHLGRQAIRARRALFDAANPDLSRRDRPQGAIPS